MGVTHVSPDAEDEESFSLMRRAHFRRAEEARRNRVTHAFQSPHDAFGEGGEYAVLRNSRDVLEETIGGAGFLEDAEGFAPEPAFISFSRSPAGLTDGLAGGSTNDPIHRATPRPAIEGSGITPQRSRSQAALLHSLDQLAGDKRFPLDHADRASAGQGQPDAGVESAETGEEGQDPGT
jgi:hypothetical protein